MLVYYLYECMLKWVCYVPKYLYDLLVTVLPFFSTSLSEIVVFDRFIGRYSFYLTVSSLAMKMEIKHIYPKWNQAYISQYPPPVLEYPHVNFSEKLKKSNEYWYFTKNPWLQEVIWSTFKDRKLTKFSEKCYFVSLRKINLLWISDWIIPTAVHRFTQFHFLLWSIFKNYCITGSKFFNMSDVCSQTNSRKVVQNWL